MLKICNFNNDKNKIAYLSSPRRVFLNMYIAMKYLNSTFTESLFSSG